MEVQTATNMHSWKTQVWKTQVLILPGWKTQVRKRETRLLCVSICMSDLKLTMQIS